MKSSIQRERRLREQRFQEEHPNGLHTHEQVPQLRRKGNAAIVLAGQSNSQPYQTTNAIPCRTCKRTNANRARSPLFVIGTFASRVATFAPSIGLPNIFLRAAFCGNASSECVGSLHRVSRTREAISLRWFTLIARWERILDSRDIIYPTYNILSVPGLALLCRKMRQMYLLGVIIYV